MSKLTEAPLSAGTSGSPIGTIKRFQAREALLPKHDALYLRACPRCGGAVRLQHLGDTDYELKCIACARIYGERPPSYRTLVGDMLVEELRELREQDANRGRIGQGPRLRASDVFRVISLNPNLTAQELAKALKCSYYAALYWRGRYKNTVKREVAS